MDTFRFAIATAADEESLELLRELSRQFARAAGLDDAGARQAGEELTAAIGGSTADPAEGGVRVSFERRDPAGPVSVDATRTPRAAQIEADPPGRSGAVRRSWAP